MAEAVSINRRNERRGIEVEIARQVSKVSTLNANISDLERHAIWNTKNHIIADLVDIINAYKSQRVDAIIILTQMKGDL